MRTLVIPDVHVPFHARNKVSKLMQFCRDTKPARVVLLGDVVDLHALTVHRQDPRWQDNLERELGSGCRFLEALRDANPRAEIQYLKGNHEDRGDRYVQGRVPAMRLIGVSLPDYLGLPDLGIEWIEDAARKPVRVPCGQGKRVRLFHGHEERKTSKMPGGIAAHFAEAFGENAHIGHTHKLALLATRVGGRDLFAVEGGFLGDPKSRAFNYASRKSPWAHSWAVYDSEQRSFPYPMLFKP